MHVGKIYIYILSKEHLLSGGDRGSEDGTGGLVS